MNPLWILLLGMAVVVGGILLLRLHAFLALIAGALLVALLTPSGYVYRYTLRSSALPVAGVDAERSAVLLKPKQALAEGTTLLVMRPASTATGYERIGTLLVGTRTEKGGETRATILSGSATVVAERDVLVVDPAGEVSAREAAKKTIGDRIATGFGETAVNIGILIAMASIIGKTLMDSGGAERIVLACRRAVGDDRAAMAFLISGFVLAALVLSDTTFYLLIPLARVMRVRSGRDYALYVLAIVSGATMTHSLVPPAPGPVFVATQLHVDLLTMIVGGVIIGAIASSSGYVYAMWANRRWVIPLRGLDGMSEAQMQNIDDRGDSALPPLWLALAPIVTPVVLIGVAAVAGNVQRKPDWLAPFLPVIRTVGEKNVALSIAAAIGLLTLWLRGRGTAQRGTARKAVGEGLHSAGVMVLIISAGGAFGYVLRQMDIAASVKDMVPASKLALLPLAFAVATAARTAQGSAIVSMITAVAIVSPVAAAGALGFHPVYLALAIGCGSKPFMWMNDAGFWIIGKMSGMTEGETLKTASVLMAIMGVVGLLATILGAWMLPMGT